MKIELPESLEPWIEEQTRLGGFPSIDAYVENVLRQEQHGTRKQIEQRLLQALDSGDGIDVTPKFWKQRRNVLEKRIRGAAKVAR